MLDRDTLHLRIRLASGLRRARLRRPLVLDLREAAGRLRRLHDAGGHDRRGARSSSTRGRPTAVGRRSPRSLYREDLATFGEGDVYDQADAGGFIRLFGLPERVRALTRERLGEKADRTVGGGRSGTREEIKR